MAHVVTTSTRTQCVVNEGANKDVSKKVVNEPVYTVADGTDIDSIHTTQEAAQARADELNA